MTRCYIREREKQKSEGKMFIFHLSAHLELYEVTFSIVNVWAYFSVVEYYQLMLKDWFLLVEDYFQEIPELMVEVVVFRQHDCQSSMVMVVVVEELVFHSRY